MEQKQINKLIDDVQMVKCELNEILNLIDIQTNFFEDLSNTNLDEIYEDMIIDIVEESEKYYTLLGMLRKKVSELKAKI